MKLTTKLASLVLAVLLALSCVACTQDIKTPSETTDAPETDPAGEAVYKVRLSEIADGASSAVKIAVEYTASAAKPEQSTDADAPKTATVTINGTEYAGTYQHTFKNDGKIDRHAYRTDGASFSVTPGGKLTDFRDSSLLTKELGQTLTDAELIDVARSFTGRTSDRAEISKSSDGNHIVTLTRMLGELPTTDFCKVYLRADGTIYTFQGLDLYESFPENVTSPFDLANARASLAAKAKEIYAEGITVTEYEMTFTVLPDQTPALSCRIRATRAEGIAVDTFHILTLS